MLTGSQITFMVYRHFRFPESDATLAALTELFEVRVHGGGVKNGLYDWDMCLNRMRNHVEYEHLANMFTSQLKTVPELNQRLSL